MGQMVYFPNGAKSGEKTAVNGAAPHFGIRRNFFWLHSFFSIFRKVDLRGPLNSCHVLSRYRMSSGPQPLPKRSQSSM